MKRNIAGVGEVAVPTSPKEKMQNFWYHYKWHTLVSLLLVFAILICSLQFCKKEDYDAYILYAGSRNIGRTAEDGNVAEIATVISSLKRITDDFDGDGEIKPNFTNYYYLSSSEAKELEDPNEQLLMSDKESLSSVLEHSEYYLVFVSVAVYESYFGTMASEALYDLSEHKAAHPELEYYSNSAIYLSSTDAYKLPGLSNLPADTLICIRRPNVFAAKSNEHTEHVNNAKKMLVNILELKIK